MSVPRGEVGDPAEIEHLALGETLFRTSYQLKIAGHPDPSQDSSALTPVGSVRRQHSARQ
jgi:hypothetical protein